MPVFYRTVSTTGPSAPITLDHFKVPFNATVGVEKPAGTTASFKVEFTLDDLNDPSWTAIWFDDANIGAGTTASAVGNYMFPVRAVRVNVASISGGPVRLVAIQGGDP